MTPPGFLDRFRLDGKTAVVTGAVGILGQHFCRGLAEAGAQVAVVDLDEDTCAAFADELSTSYGVRCLGFACDITRPESVVAMVAAVAREFGGVDVLHNNVGGKTPDLDAYFSPFEGYSLDEWRRVMAVNVDGVFLVDQAIGRQMLAQGTGGSIIHTASVYGALAPDQRIYEGSEYLGRAINTPAIYTASKAAIIGLTQYLATYWADKGIRVNCISPGGAESGQNDEFKRRYSARIPLGRMARADEMVNALLFLASDASSYVTGQNLMVDGGLSAW